MMNREQCALLLSLILFISLYSVKAADTCSAYKYVHVKIANDDTTKTPRFEQFHGLDSGQHENFDVTGTYDSTHICGIFLTEKIDYVLTDHLAVLWSSQGGTLKSDGASIQNDLSGYWQLCGQEDCKTNPACNLQGSL